MAGIPNAFKVRAADRSVLDVSLFLPLYCPNLLRLLQPGDLSAPAKLLVLRGSPGSGKSSLLRLFETDTLLAMYRRRKQASEEALLERLTSLGVINESGPQVIGIYLDCDSSLREIANLPLGEANAKVLNTMLDVRIVSGFLRSVKSMLDAGLLPQKVKDTILAPLPMQDTPPVIFSKAHTLESLRVECDRIETDFGTLLNGFPGDPIPSSIQPHARIFSLSFLSHQKQVVATLEHLVPLVMLDNLHELYRNQRQQILNDFLTRSGLPRWIALRKHVLELEQLISFEGAKDDRDFREMDLDGYIGGISSSVFKNFVTDVAKRRLSRSNALQQYGVSSDLKSLLSKAEDTINREKIVKELDEVNTRFKQLNKQFDQQSESASTSQMAETVSIQELFKLEGNLIKAERKVRQKQRLLFPEILSSELSEPLDSKIQSAAELFAARRFKLPYYHSFDVLAEVSNGNVDQFLTIAGTIVDKLIFRAELGKEIVLSAQDQQDLLQEEAKKYYQNLEKRLNHGFAIRQLVDNLGLFFQEVTNRANAPIAPGVNGFGMDIALLRRVLNKRVEADKALLLRAVLTTAVANNVFSVRLTKQGQAGSFKIVVYLNRLLCVRFNLPLGFGGFQPLQVDDLIRMMEGPVSAKEWSRKRGTQLVFEE